jgi:hypothetical protein
MRRARCLPFLHVVAAAACGGGGAASDPVAAAETQVLACRARVDRPAQYAEVARRDGRNLGTSRLADRAGVERSARLAPDGDAVVLVREADHGDPDSRDVFVASLSGAFAERRITGVSGRDDGACWSPDGAVVLFASARAGGDGLWLAPAAGGAATPFAAVPTGFADFEPDWHAATGRVAWSRRGPTGVHALWRADADGSGAIPVTDGGGASGIGNGDREPAFAPDGQSVVFVRRSGGAAASLCRCELATGAVTTLVAPAGDVRTPRIAPAADRVFFGLAEPAAGRGTIRLAHAPIAGGPAVLVWPDERWELAGLDLLPTLPALPAAGAPTTLDVGAAQVQIPAASSAFGDRAMLRAVDGDEYQLTTTTVDGREIAGINVRFDLPVAAEDVLELRVRIRLRVDRADGDSMLRTSLYNPVDERFDTVVELAYTTDSLRHVTSQRQARITAIADLAPGPRAELRIDLVELVVVPRAR